MEEVKDGANAGTIVRSTFDGRCLDVDNWELVHDNVVNVWVEHDENTGTTFAWEPYNPYELVKKASED